MPKNVQMVRHDTAGADAFTGKEGQITVDTTAKALRVHDSVTLGGIAQARADLNNVADATASSAGKMSAALFSSLQTVIASAATNAANIATNAADIVTAEADIATLQSDKADKVTGHAANDIAALDAAGNLITTGQQLAGLANIPAGTTMIFWQAAPPTGWTKRTNGDLTNAGIRLTTGTGGGSGGSNNWDTVFSGSKATNGHALTIPEIPPHTHSYDGPTNTKDGGGIDQAPYNRWTGNDTSGTTGSTGSGNAHSHTIPNMQLKYAMCVVGQRD